MTPHQALVLAEARAWVGTPYVHQASQRGAGTDCLGLLRGVWRAVVGAEPAPVPPYTPDWGEAGGRELLLTAARQWLVCGASPEPGDVLLFRMRDEGIAKHLGIATRAGVGGSFIHAYTGHGVVESPLSGPWARRIVARLAFPEGA